MTTALHYSSITSPNDSPQIYGLQVAIADLLKAYFRYSRQEKFNVLIGDKMALAEIKDFAAKAKIDPQRLTLLDHRYARENFSSFDTVFRADPHPQKLFWQRQQLAGIPFNLCTLAHAISGLEGGDLLERYCLDPSLSTDAIICPSRAVASAIRSFWDLYGDYLKQRFGVSYHCPVQLPVIPLGIDVDTFEKKTTEHHREDQRKKLGINNDDIVLLWVGRLSHAIKAHPLAMFQTAERAARETGASVHLIMVGYFVPPEAQEQFSRLAQEVMKSAKVTFMASNDPRFPDGLWAAGDIFLSLVDNMQESFGLTPIEAMAAGLPRVISDWDGYRDSVTHGQDGYLIPTHQPPSGSGRSLSELLLSGREIYGGFLAKTAQCVAVDQERATEAIVNLIRDPSKRKDMATKARARVRATYDWRHIIPAYEDLWTELAAQRHQQGALFAAPHWPSALPQAPDPFTMYASYPSSSFQELGTVRMIVSFDTVSKLWQHDINTLGLDVLLPLELITKILHQIAQQAPSLLKDLLSECPAPDRPALWRTLGWLIKLGILQYNEP